MTRTLVSTVLLAVSVATARPAQARSPGEHQVHVVHDGQRRTCVAYVPVRALGGSPPLVVMLHGGGGSGQGARSLSRMDDVADREGFVVAYPDALDGHWNDGRTVNGEPARGDQDDVGFLRALVDRLEARFGIDPRRVYVAGMSNGAMMTQRLAIEAADVFAAFASVAGLMPRDLAQAFAPARRAVPMLVIHGTADPIVPWGGGPVGFTGAGRHGEVASAQETVRLWAEHNGCRDEATTREPDRDPEDGTRVLRTEHTGGRAPVVLLKVRGGGHSWPGGGGRLSHLFTGPQCFDISASEEAWAFFAAHRLRR